MPRQLRTLSRRHRSIHRPFLFDEQVIRHYELDVADADWQWLNEHALDEQFVPATVNFEGETYESAAVRYKGAVGSLKSCFDAEGNRTCLKLITQGELQRIRGRTLPRAQEAALPFHGAGPHPRCAMRLATNCFVTSGCRVLAPPTPNSPSTGEYLGVFAFVEYVDGRFTRRRFPPNGGEGNLYKAAWPQPGKSQQYFLNRLRTNEDESPSVGPNAPFSPRKLELAEPEEIAQIAQDWQIKDQFMRYMAVARLIDHMGWHRCVVLQQRGLVRKP